MIMANCRRLVQISKQASLLDEWNSTFELSIKSVPHRRRQTDDRLEWDRLEWDRP